MRKRFLRKLTALAIACLMLFSLYACDASSLETTKYPENGTKKIISVDKDLYLPNLEKDSLSVAYYENQPEILLIELTSAIQDIINGIALALQNASIEITETNTKLVLTRENGAYCEMDFVKDTIYFSEFDSFSAKGYATSPQDSLSSAYLNEEGKNVFLKREMSIFTPGYSYEIDLAERNIPLDIYNGKKYMPLQTFNDIFVSPYGFNFSYNSQDVFLFTSLTMSEELSEIYYSVEPTNRSTALAEFNYNELCLFLDLYYGLKYEHGIYDGFAYYLEKIGLKEKFLKLDAAYSFTSLANLTFSYLADIHSLVLGASPYTGSIKPTVDDPVQLAPNVIQNIQDSEFFKNARDSQLPNPAIYQKIGNTAYVTIDQFTWVPRNTYDTALQIGDTVDVIIYAHQQISQDPEIENVVVDLSCSIGGTIDSAAYLTAWMLGSCSWSLYNTVTDSCGTTKYVADVNLDYEFNEQDTIADKNLYCIISPVSFSCANYVPALLKNSNKVTIIGQQSSGGACIVRPAVTADGTLFMLSSARQMAIVKNGTYYGVDEGVVPDIYLSKVESFYNREALTNYINGLK